MKYYKTAEGMFTAAFEERGYTDDQGNPIKATEQPMNKKEWLDHRQNSIQIAWDQLRTKAVGSDCYIGSSRFILIEKDGENVLEEHREGWRSPFYHY